MKRDYEENSRIPVELYSAYVAEQAEAGRAWEEAKRTNNYAIYAPHLQKMIDYVTEMTQ